MVIHKEARCFEPDGRNYIIKAAELFDVKLRRRIKDGCELFTLDGMNRLFLREAETPHLYCLDGQPRENLSRSETDPAHTQHVVQLLRTLRKWEEEKCAFKIGYNTWPDLKTPAVFTPFLNLGDYIWRKEETHNLSDVGYCRFDIAGKHREGIGAVKSNTMVAIEVIYTSTPSQQTLQAQLDHSRNLPTLIMYCVIPRPPHNTKIETPEYFLKIDERAKTIRTIFYIYDGYGWKGDRKIPNCTAARLEEEINKMVKNDPNRPDQQAKRKPAEISPPGG